MKNVYVYSYNTVSNGARELAKALDVDRIRHQGSRFKGAPFKKVINWGSSEVPKEVSRCEIWNEPNVVQVASNKLHFFRKMTNAPENSRPRLVPWTVNPDTAESWIKGKSAVVCRTVLTGHSGHGIIISNTLEELVTAPLYTQYVPKSHEFRIHIIAGEIIDEQRKIRDPDREPLDWKVRSHDNGFMYVRNGFTVPEDVKRQSVAAFMASGLDFGAVDCIWSDKQQKAYVLEINTAPGLEGTTVNNYAAGFKKHLS